MKAWRIAFAASGLLLGLFGVFRLVTEVPIGNLLVLAGWMIGAVVIHDGILSPAVIVVGWFAGRVVPARARRYVQGALIAGGLITVVAIPLILHAGQEAASKALLRQNFGGNLTILLGAVAAVSLVLYAVRVARETRDTGNTHTASRAEPSPNSRLPKNRAVGTGGDGLGLPTSAGDPVVSVVVVDDGVPRPLPDAGPTVDR